MRCLACNVLLKDVDATRRFKESGEFVDLCQKCSGWLPDDVQTVTNPDLEELEEDVSIELDALDVPWDEYEV